MICSIYVETAHMKPTVQSAICDCSHVTNIIFVWLWTHILLQALQTPPDAKSFYRLTGGRIMCLFVLAPDQL